MSDRPSLPGPLAGLKELTLPLVQDVRTFCTLHGAQPGPNCELCDVHFPDAVRAREIGLAPGAAIGYTKAEVEDMVSRAVKAALDEQKAFNAWKQSEEGQAAAAVAQTAGAVTPQHGPSEGDPVSQPVPVSTIPSLEEWTAAGYDPKDYDAFVGRFKKPSA